MSKVLRIRAPILRQRQRGISLLVVLILLLVMSVLGIAVLRSSGMQERMSANMVDRNEAVQAAEAGLLVAQRTVIRGTFNPMWDGGATFTGLGGGGAACAAAPHYCDRSDPTGNASTTWQTAQPPASADYTVMSNLASYAFTIEYLGKAKGESAEVQGACNTSAAPTYLCERPMFRVTSYGRGRGLAQAVMQANILSQPQ